MVGHEPFSRVQPSKRQVQGKDHVAARMQSHQHDLQAGDGNEEHWKERHQSIPNQQDLVGSLCCNYMVQGPPGGMTN